MDDGITADSAATPHGGIHRHPDGPSVEILQASSGWGFLDLGKAWRYRELAWVLAARDIKVRYKQAVIGAGWAILQPLALIIILPILFRALGRPPISDEATYPYAISLACGLLPWQLFANGLRGASESLVAHQDMIKKIYFPRILLPTAPIITALVDFLVALSVLVLLMVYYQIVPGWGFLALPCFALMAALCAFSIGLWFSSLNAVYRDLRHAVPFLIQVGFFVTPVFYEAAKVPARWQPLYVLNPMVGIVEGFRWSLLGTGQPPWMMIGFSCLSIAVLLVGGAFCFRRLERVFVDWI